MIWLRQQPDQFALVNAAYYDDPIDAAATRYWKSEEWDKIRSCFDGATGRALDVGAGRGIASFALAKDGFSVTALEPDGSTLVGAGAIRGLSKRQGLNVKVVQEFSEDLPFEDEYFDLVFARAVLHHTSDLRKACSEFCRVLKPGGRFIAVREHVISKKSDLQEFLQRHPLHNLYGGEHAYLLNEYCEAIECAGLSIEEILKPLESVINFAPFTEDTLKDELVDRLRVPALLRNVSRSLLNAPGIWSILTRILSFVDHRPGRLYSFICERR